MGDSWAWAGYLYQEDEMTHAEGPSYQEMKLAEKGYPGVTSQQDAIYAKAGDPGMYDVNAGEGSPGTGMYRPHAYVPQPVGLITYGCSVCGMGREHTVHNKIGTTSNNAKGSPMKNPYLEVEVYSPNTVNYRIENIPNDQAMRIVSEVLPKVVDLWLNKSKDYGGNVMQLMKLGPRACIPDMLRKFGKLKRAIWDGQEMVGEQPEEILMDLVGHVLIILDEMSNDDNS